MFVGFIKMLKALFEVQQPYSRLEAFIIQGNPQSTFDIESLERKFERQERARQSHYY